MPYSILLVEDEQLVGSMIQLNLMSEGYDITWVKTPRDAFSFLHNTSYSLIILDITLPGGNGLSLLTHLRKNNDTTPVLMVTAMSNVETKVKAFNQGADDYLPKPFDMQELIARVGALIRRSQQEVPAHSTAIASISIGNTTINLNTMQARTKKGQISLSQKEGALLSLLYRNKGNVVSRSDILEEVWGMEVSPTERTVDNFIVKLRKLIEQDPNKPAHIITVRGIGYTLNE